MLGVSFFKKEGSSLTPGSRRKHAAMCSVGAELSAACRNVSHQTLARSLSRQRLSTSMSSRPTGVIRPQYTHLALSSGPCSRRGVQLLDCLYGAWIPAATVQCGSYAKRSACSHNFLLVVPGAAGGAAHLCHEVGERGFQDSRVWCCVW